MTLIVLGTRSTPLAVAQSEIVAGQLRQQGYEVELREMSSLGDRSLGGSLAQGKGMFTAELSEALRSGAVDVVVHSLKDLPVADEPDLVIAAIPRRERPHDLLLIGADVELNRLDQSGVETAGGAVPLLDLLEEPEKDCNAEVAFGLLPRGSRLGTSSPRRQAGALHARSDLICVAIRGSVGRRLEWLRDGACEAMILAEAGLLRIAGDETVRRIGKKIRAIRLGLDTWPCAPGQGALAVQVLRDGPWHRHQALEALDDPATRKAVIFERELLSRLGGGCETPFGACHFDAGPVDEASAGPEVTTTAAMVASPSWNRAAAGGRRPEVSCWHGEPGRELDEALLDEASARLASIFGQEERPSRAQLEAAPELAVTSTPSGSDRLSRRLPPEVRVSAFSCTETIVLDEAWPSPAAELCGPRRNWPWVVVSSPTVARLLVERCRNEPIWGRLPWCALSEGTARELLGLGIPPNLVAKAREAGELADYLLEILSADNKLYLPQSARASKKLAGRLGSGGRTVVAWQAYAVSAKSPLRWPAEWAGAPERILFTAASQVEAFEASDLSWPRRCWAVGKSTGESLRAALGRGRASGRGRPPEMRVASSPTADGVYQLWREEKRHSDLGDDPRGDPAGSGR